MKNLSIILMLLVSLTSIAQDGNVGIGTKIPDESAVLDIKSTSKGILVPRLSSSEKLSIRNPAKGLLVFQLDEKEGFYFFNGNIWEPILSQSEAYSVAADPNDWTMNGNTGTNDLTNFLGTTDNKNLVFKVNNVSQMLLKSTTGQLELSKDLLVQNMTVGRGANNLPSNTALGSNVLRVTGAAGIENVGVGFNVLYSNVGGFRNTAIGYQAMYYNTSGSYNTGIGYQALVQNTSGSSNFALGQYSLGANKTGGSNVGVGTHSLRMNVTGSNNVAIGSNSGYNIKNGNNITIGGGAGYGLTTSVGLNNTIIGGEAGYQLNGSGNIFIGYQSGYSEQGSNKLYISNSNSTNPLIKGEFDNKNLRINLGVTNSTTQGYLAIGNFDVSPQMPIVGGYRLLVQDGIITEKLKITPRTSTFWADYVFEKDYSLLPLDKLEKFIIENKHLPNIPSTKEVGENGIDIALLNAKLLEKIEELTLYTIQQQKQIDFLSQKVSEISKSKDK